MKLTADRASLADAVKWVSGAISQRPAQPALAGIQIVAGSYLTITGHDFDKVHVARVPAEVTEPGVAIPAAAMVNDLLRALKGDTVDLSVDGNRLSIKAGRSSYGVNLFAPDTWPSFPAQDVVEQGTVEADELRRMVAAVSPAADDNNMQTVLRGIRFESDGDELTVVGTRSVHLATAATTWVGEEFDAQMPYGATAEAVRGLSGAVTISTSDGAFGLADEQRSVVLRVFEPGGYPAWRKLLEGYGDDDVEVEAELLRDACKRAALAGAKTNEPLTIHVDENEIEVQGGGDSASGFERLDCVSGINHVADWTTSVLLPVLASLPPTPVLLTFKPAGGSAQPMRITDKAGSFLHVVMPRRAQ